MSQWISVKDRMPEPDEIAFFLWAVNNWPTCNGSSEAAMYANKYYYNEIDGWHAYDGSTKVGISGEVTHWMGRPREPKYAWEEWKENGRRMD